MRRRCLRGRRRAFGAVSFGIVVAFFEPAREDGGRRIVGAGTPEEIAGLEGSHTGRFLRGMFGSCEQPETIGESLRLAVSDLYATAFTG